MYYPYKIKNSFYYYYYYYQDSISLNTLGPVQNTRLYDMSWLFYSVFSNQNVNIK